MSAPPFSAAPSAARPAGPSAVPPNTLTRWDWADRPDPRRFLRTLSDPPEGPAADKFVREAEAILRFGDTAVPDDTDGGGPPPAEACPVPPDGYQLEGVLGSGGAGAVWSATAPGGGACAVKFTPRTGPLADDEIRGLEMLREVNHPHVIHVYAFWVRPRDVVIAMERASGSMMDLLSDEPGGVPAGRILKLFGDAADGPDYMSFRGVRHRDVKPHNIFWIDSGGTIGAGGHERGVIADWGIAQQSFNQNTVKNDGASPPYLAPEGFSGSLHVNSDQWSLALSWLHMRTGELPNRRKRTEIPKALKRLPRRERTVLTRALDDEPAERWESCSEFVRQLRASWEPRSWVRRKVVPIAALALAGLTGLGLGAILWR